jgi:hypothetical protein
VFEELEELPGDEALQSSEPGSTDARIAGGLEGLREGLNRVVGVLEA